MPTLFTGKWARARDDAKWPRQHSNYTGKLARCCPWALDVQLCIAATSTFLKVPLCNIATNAATNLFVNGFAASLLSPDTTFQFRIQDVHILLAEGQVVSLCPICKNGWLSDNVAFLAFYFGRQTLYKARNFRGYRRRAQRLNRCQAVMVIFSLVKLTGFLPSSLQESPFSSQQAYPHTDIKYKRTACDSRHLSKSSNVRKTEITRNWRK